MCSTYMIHKSKRFLLCEDRTRRKYHLGIKHGNEKSWIKMENFYSWGNHRSSSENFPTNRGADYEKILLHTWLKKSPQNPPSNLSDSFPGILSGIVHSIVSSIRSASENLPCRDRAQCTPESWRARQRVVVYVRMAQKHWRWHASKTLTYPSLSWRARGCVCVCVWNPLSHTVLNQQCRGAISCLQLIAQSIHDWYDSGTLESRTCR